jgi:UDP-2-acetamido-2,6-beta-L-arabino-hexul-4-ose reductase
MNILITGANGFIGKNLIKRLNESNDYTIFPFDLESSPEDLERYTKECDFVFHLAGVNRPKDEREFLEGNFGFTSILISKLKQYKNTCPIMIASSIQAELNNPYGISKKAGEDLMFEYSKETGSKVLVYRFENVFGKWARPNYNSAVATFSHNIANDLPITINDPNVEVQLIYIDDVVNELINALHGKETMVDKFACVKPVHKIKLGKIAELLYSFKESRANLSIPQLDDPFVKKLYSNYLSYLPQNRFIYDLKMNVDQRGSFTEFLKTEDRGQVSINISKPGIVKGNHWHHSKTEKFLVVSGTGVIRFRQVDSTEVIEYFVNGDELQVVDIPPGYTHNIENLGTTDLVTVMWAKEKFDKDKPDTIFEEV